MQRCSCKNDTIRMPLGRLPGLVTASSEVLARALHVTVWRVWIGSKLEALNYKHWTRGSELEALWTRPNSFIWIIQMELLDSCICLCIRAHIESTLSALWTRTSHPRALLLSSPLLRLTNEMAFDFAIKSNSSPNCLPSPKNRRIHPHNLI